MIQKYIISLPPITKKNSQQILTNHRTGKPFIAPSRQYKKYEQAAMWYLTPKPKAPLSGRYRVATVFYMPTRRKVDLTNLMEAAHDTLVAAKILADDNNAIITSVDGSRRKNHVECPAHKALLRFLHPQAQYQKRAGSLPAPQGCRCFEKKEKTRRASIPEENHKTH